MSDSCSCHGLTCALIFVGTNDGPGVCVGSLPQHCGGEPHRLLRPGAGRGEAQVLPQLWRSDSDWQHSRGKFRWYTLAFINVMCWLLPVLNQVTNFYFVFTSRLQCNFKQNIRHEIDWNFLRLMFLFARIVIEPIPETIIESVLWIRILGLIWNYYSESWYEMEIFSCHYHENIVDTKVNKLKT